LPGRAARCAGGAVMTCLHRIRLRCPACWRVFCVPVACRGVEVWHRECDASLDVIGDEFEVAECERATVAWYKDSARNEVRPNEES
jgi:hypothetical protein